MKYFKFTCNSDLGITRLGVLPSKKSYFYEKK